MRTLSRWLHLGLGNAGTPADRALLVEQFRILTSQVPVLYGVLIVESLSVSYVLPSSLPPWFRLGRKRLLPCKLPERRPAHAHHLGTSDLAAAVVFR
jgi:hypothetical protein